jgi:ATP-dependent DNA helicase RecQ
MAEVHDILKRFWGYDSFRPLQEDIIHSVLNGKDTLAVLPTGGGKSICFQVPAMAREGLCIVVSPLIALMKDQVENLKKRNIPALLIHSGMKKADVVLTLKNATQDYFKFLYVSPERLETSLFLEYLPALNVNLIAVDEAHCISQWGYDFRPSYRRIATLREELQGVPVLALTASATPEVQADIREQLHFHSDQVFRQSFSRKNLSYSVFKVDSKLARLAEIIKKVPGTAIVYVKSRRRTTEVMNLLQMEGISASNYHAGLKPEERNDRQQQWIDNKVRVMACTNAFGMGIDKPDVRLVVHLDIPDSLENYYQEAGRAGRDGKKAYAVLLYDERDIKELSQLADKRFPSLETIKKTYQALVQYLQIPSYTGEYQSFEFAFESFVRNFKLSANEALYALKALEQDGWIELQERSYSPATVVVNATKRNLEEFLALHPEHEGLVTTLMRTYGGILDYPAYISGVMLARLMKKTEDEIRKQLKQISRYGVLVYSPQNEEPRISFQKNRVPVQEFTFQVKPYKKRKDMFVRRVEAMKAYATTPECRSRFIGNYFGEEDAGTCGICDSCLQKKDAPLSQEEFRQIAVRITTELKQQAWTMNDLLEKIRPVRKEKAWKVIEFLQSEHKIVCDAKGMLRLREV